jgi:hypothetical protein
MIRFSTDEHGFTRMRWIGAVVLNSWRCFVVQSEAENDKNESPRITRINTN